MSGGGSDEVAVPLLEPTKSEEGSSDAKASNYANGLRNAKRSKRLESGRVNSFCLPAHSGHFKEVRTRRLRSFKRTVQVLQLDHSQIVTSVLSWFIGLLLVIAIPVLRLRFVKASSDDSSHELIFQPFVVVVGIALSMVSFLFLTQAIRRHGLRGVLFLDAAEEEVMEVEEEYNAIIERSRMLLAKLFIPSFILFVMFKVWFHMEISLEPLPFESKTTARSLAVIIPLISLSWIFQTTTYLYSCVLFSTVCSLQELKMLKFKALLADGFDPEFFFSKYAKITKGLRATSHRFRAFLALIFSITIVGFLTSMYEVVEAERAGIDTLMAGEILILNWVSLSGVGLCLKASSKLAHLHRRIVKAAASMHARTTFEMGGFEDLSNTGGASNDPGRDSIIEKLSNYFQVQDACSRRAALVNYLSTTSAGISVYGFVLDRFFIHASIGILLTTTWFILGRSLKD